MGTSLGQKTGSRPTFFERGFGFETFVSAKRRLLFSFRRTEAVRPRRHLHLHGIHVPAMEFVLNALLEIALDQVVLLLLEFRFLVWYFESLNSEQWVESVHCGAWKSAHVLAYLFSHQ